MNVLDELHMLEDDSLSDGQFDEFDPSSWPQTHSSHSLNSALSKPPSQHATIPLRLVESLNHFGHSRDSPPIAEPALILRSDEILLSFLYCTEKCHSRFDIHQIATVSKEHLAIAINFRRFIRVNHHDLWSDSTNCSPFIDSQSPLKDAIALILHVNSHADCDFIFRHFMKNSDSLRIIHPYYMLSHQDLTSQSIKIPTLSLETHTQDPTLLIEKSFQECATMNLQFKKRDIATPEKVQNANVDQEHELQPATSTATTQSKRSNATQSRTSTTQHESIALYAIDQKYLMSLLPMDYQKLDDLLKTLIQSLITTNRLSIYQLTNQFVRVLRKATSKEEVNRATQIILKLATTNSILQNEVAVQKYILEGNTTQCSKKENSSHAQVHSSYENLGKDIYAIYPVVPLQIHKEVHHYYHVDRDRSLSSSSLKERKSSSGVSLKSLRKRLCCVS